MAHVATVTIDSGQVAADQTDFPIYIDLSDLPSSFWDVVANGGGDIRVFKDDDSTELAREVVACDTSDDSGEMHVKFTGTLSSSVDTVIHIHADGVSSEPAVTATYGRNAVWSDYYGVWHFNEDPTDSAPQVPDATGGGKDITSNGTMTSGDLVAGQMGNGWTFDGVDDYGAVAGTPSDFIASEVSMMQWARVPTISNGNEGHTLYISDASSPFNKLTIGVSYLYFRTSSSTATQLPPTTAPTAEGGNWVHCVATMEEGHQKLYTNGAANGAETNAFNPTDITGVDSAEFALSKYNGGTTYIETDIAEYRYRKDIVSATWIETEYNNQSDASTFYSVEAVEDANNALSMCTF